MSATATQLQADQALAKRWLRTRCLPVEAWQWLGGRALPSAEQRPVPTVVPSALDQALAEFGKPLSSHSNEHQVQALSATLRNVASLFAWCYSQVKSPVAAAATERMLAACVLPLYRGLASGTIDQVTSVLKRQLADALALVALESEFENDFRELIAEGMERDQTPYQVVERVLNLDLSRLAQRLLVTAQQFDSGSPSSAGGPNTNCELKMDPRPDWGESHVLWRLAGELIADRAEFVVPRPWINVPVPWSEASDHWREVAQALKRVEPTAVTTLASELSPTSASAVTSVATTAVTPQEPTEERPEESSALATSPASAPVDEITRLKLEIEIADSVDALVQASRGATRGPVPDRGIRTDGSSGLSGSRTRSDFIVPKIIIAEVRSHNDPAFVTIVRRQVALCRSEERTMSLVAVRVEPDSDEGEMPTLQSLGLACWQQQLVNWMADHPEIHDPYAFVSSEGELILCLIDIERNTSTGLLRQGLIEILTGQSLGDGSGGLSRVSTPARYHSGIGSISSPSAGFEAEQLIEATYRCLAAAQRHGKASIKSIEVF